jgi:hypothetical protein
MTSSLSLVWIQIQGLCICFVLNYKVIVLTESSVEEQLSLGTFCHSNSIKFIVAETRGVFGLVVEFCVLY